MALAAGRLLDGNDRHRGLTGDDKPDSARVVFVSERADGCHFNVVTVDIGETLPLTSERSAQAYPAWRL